jgi:predicted transcriptional regulator
MLTVRLPRDLEKKIEELASTERTTKSQIIKNALREYIEIRKAGQTPYELGKDLFGRFESSEAELSKNYKKKIKEKLFEKHSH